VRPPVKLCKLDGFVILVIEGILEQLFIFRTIDVQRTSGKRGR
jgi:hypothetical protein